MSDESMLINSSCTSCMSACMCFKGVVGDFVYDNRGMHELHELHEFFQTLLQKKFKRFRLPVRKCQTKVTDQKALIYRALHELHECMHEF